MEIVISLAIMFIGLSVSALRRRNWRRAMTADLLDAIATISPPLEARSEGALFDLATSLTGESRLQEAYLAMLRRVEMNLGNGVLPEEIRALAFSYPPPSLEHRRWKKWTANRRALLQRLQEAQASWAVRDDFKTVSHQYGAGLALRTFLCDPSEGVTVFYQRDVHLPTLKARLADTRRLLRRWFTKQELALLQDVIQRERAEVDWHRVFLVSLLVLVCVKFLIQRFT